jgi:hypothetical protein
MKLWIIDQAETYLEVYDRSTGKVLRRIRPQDELERDTARMVSTRPRRLLQYAKHVERRFRAETGGELDFGIRARCVTSINNRGLSSRVDESVDLTRERIRVFGSYRWYRRERTLPSWRPLS